MSDLAIDEVRLDNGGYIIKLTTATNNRIAYVIVYDKATHNIFSTKSVYVGKNFEFFVPLAPGEYDFTAFESCPLLNDYPLWLYWGQTNITFNDLDVYTFGSLT